MDYKNKVEELVYKEGVSAEVFDSCEKCVEYRKQTFQAKNIVLKIDDAVKISSLGGDKLYGIWVMLTGVSPTSDTLIGTVETADTPGYPEGTEIVFKKPEVMDFYAKDWDEESAFKHIFFTLTKLRDNHIENKHGED